MTPRSPASPSPAFEAVARCAQFRDRIAVVIKTPGLYLHAGGHPASFLIYTSALAGAMLIVVAVVALANNGQLSRRPLQRRMAYVSTARTLG